MYSEKDKKIHISKPKKAILSKIIYFIQIIIEVEIKNFIKLKV